jgi:hypothetical protein
MFPHTLAKYARYEQEFFFPDQDHTFELITYSDTAPDPTLKPGHETKNKTKYLNLF